MAFNRIKSKVYSKDLGNYIAAQIILLQNNRSTKNLESEAKFTNAVLNENLSYDQQLDYRKQQLAELDNSDKTEKRRLRGEIAKLNDLIEQKKYTDDYLVEVDQMNSGAQSIDETLKWLKNRLTNTTDMAIKSDINKEIADLNAKRYTLQISAITKQTEYANNNKTPEILDAQIEKVKKQRTSAALIGDDDLVATLDLQLQSLNKSKNESKINDISLKMAVDTIAGQSATGMLDAIDSAIKNADTANPITIDGIRYSSEQQFWQSQQGKYLNDRSSNGFFSRLKSEIADRMTYKQSKGILINDSLADVNKTYESLNAYPELKNYAEKIAQDNQAVLQTTADIRSNDILNEYYIKGDVNTAIKNLAYLKDKYGVDQTTNYQKIISAAAKDKQEQIQQILSTMNDLMSKNPGMSSGDALTAAIASGAGAIYSPETLAGTKASELIKGMADTAAAQQSGEDKTGTITNNPTATPQLTEGGLYKLGNSSSVMLYEKGKLRTFIGNWNEEQFKQMTGKSFADVKVVNNLTGIPQGDPITLTTTPPANVNNPNQPIPTTTPAGAIGSITDNKNGTYTYINKDGTPHIGPWGDNYADNTSPKTSGQQNQQVSTAKLTVYDSKGTSIEIPASDLSKYQVMGYTNMPPATPSPQNNTPASSPVIVPYNPLSTDTDAQKQAKWIAAGNSGTAPFTGSSYSSSSGGGSSPIPAVSPAPTPAPAPASNPKVQVKDVNGNTITVYKSSIPALKAEGTIK